MAMLMKVIRGSHNRATNQRTQRLQQEAVRKREDPTLYQVKQKLKKHPNPKYSTMTEEEMTREASFLTNPDELKKLFSELTHKPFQTLLEEVNSESFQESADTGHHSSYEKVKQKHLKKVGELTLKLHLRHLDETPSSMARLGAVLLKIPYGVLHAALEIGDTTNPNVSYILEFNDASLVQPRRKSLIETSSLEATIPLGGGTFKVTDSAWPQPVSLAESVVKREIAGMKTGIPEVDNYLSDEHKPVRPRSICMTERPHHLVKSKSVSIPRREATESAACARVASSLPIKYRTDSAPGIEAMACAQCPDPTTSRESFTVPPHVANRGEDLTPYIRFSLSKILLIEKLVKVIVKYNKNYYYNSISRNRQTFVIDVLQSLGVWENFRLGDKLELYLKNLNKGRKEVYKSHKSVNDRVKYLAVSGELEETSYDDLRYFRSLYAVYHFEESTGNSASAACRDPDCLLKVVEKSLKEKRPEGATTLLPPEHYV